MSLHPDLIRAFEALAPVAEFGAVICRAAGDGKLDAPTDLRTICTSAGLSQARSADLEQALLRGQACGLFERHSAMTWRCVNDSLARDVVPMLEGVHVYLSKLHRDDDIVDVVLTKPPSPSQMSEKLESMLAGSWGLRDTKELLPTIAESAKQSFTIMTPYLDETGAEIVINLFRRAQVPERYLVLRTAADGQPPSGLACIGPALNSHGVKVLNFKIERPDASGNETFHAKVVLADASSAYVGSSNMLKWSFEYSLELGLYVRGKAASRISDILKAIRAVSAEMHP